MKASYRLLRLKEVRALFSGNLVHIGEISVIGFQIDYSSLRNSGSSCQLNINNASADWSVID